MGLRRYRNCMRNEHSRYKPATTAKAVSLLEKHTHGYKIKL